ncbi:54S ribosomal protein L4, mitochondrial [Lophiotrema nucula]|uniref:Large ribosomal subunit protein uL29m n=1 Tax=Lophiotrema nucula TaxID=690887 RepID=A0A6A5Z225_9PLEO|nr:54S ribosomal protein L4, mitochondrial [Lophiotrema nucula]
MAAIPTRRAVRSRLTSIPPSELILPFLAPSFQRSAPAPYAAVSQFSTSPALCKRTDNNKNRGVSILRHTGLRPRQKLSVRLKDLPKPRSQRESVEGAPNHGLYGFFKDKKLLQYPKDERSHGKSWTIFQLRNKSWDDLHVLWWVCVKERNRLATQILEHQRIEAGYGATEYENRDKTVQETMKAIHDALLERQYAWEDAYQLARDDPQINLSGDGPVYDESATIDVSVVSLN